MPAPPYGTKRIRAAHDVAPLGHCQNVAVARTWPVSGDALTRVAVPILGVLNALAVALVPLRSTLPLQTQPSTSAVAASIDLVAGVSLLSGGILATALRPTSPMGTLTILASIAWFAPDWAGWQAAAPVIASLALIGAPMLLPFVLHLVAAGTRAWEHAAVRRLVRAGYAVTVLLALSRAAVRDPFLDLDCLAPPRYCGTNVFLIRSSPELAQLIDLALVVTLAVLGAALFTLALWRLAGATTLARRAEWPLLLTGAGVGAAQGGYVLAAYAEHAETAHDQLLGWLYVLLGTSVTLLAGAVLLTVARTRKTAARMARLATDIGAVSGRGGLQSVLRGILEDPTLTVAYRVSDEGPLVDSDGRPVQAAPDTPGRVMTPIVRGDREIAVVVHDAGAADPSALGDTIGPTARLAVDNERLMAQVLTQFAARPRRASRIVQAGDAARQGLERDLHDGAQQRLLALTYELRLGRRRGGARGRCPARRRPPSSSVRDGSHAPGASRARTWHLPRDPRRGGLAPPLQGSRISASLPVEISGTVGERCPGSQRERCVRRRPRRSRLCLRTWRDVRPCDHRAEARVAVRLDRG